MQPMYEPQFRSKKNGVPILKNEEIEQDAELFIRDFNPDLLKNPQPVDIEHFIEYYLNLTFEFNYLTHCGLILGRMVFNDTDKMPIYVPEMKQADYITAKRGTVMIDNTLLEDEHRLRSTMGHEAGHWIYHPGYYCIDPNQMTMFDTTEKITTACRRFDIEGGDCPEGGRKTLVTDHDWIEHHAKFFSAAILMPREAMRIVCLDSKHRKDITLECMGFENAILANEVAEIFNVSAESARIRISQLGYGFENDMVIRPTLFSISYPDSVISM